MLAFVLQLFRYNCCFSACLTSLLPLWVWSRIMHCFLVFFSFLNNFESFVMLTFLLQLFRYESHTSLLYFPVLANAKQRLQCEFRHCEGAFSQNNFNMNDIFYALFYGVISLCCLDKLIFKQSYLAIKSFLQISATQKAGRMRRKVQIIQCRNQQLLYNNPSYSRILIGSRL